MLGKILKKIVSNPSVYDMAQKIAGREQNYRRLMPLLNRAKGELLLDIGAGTGEITRILHASTRYIWLDNDPEKLRGFLSKRPDGLAILGDVPRIPLGRSVV